MINDEYIRNLVNEGYPQIYHGIDWNRPHTIVSRYKKIAVGTLRDREEWSLDAPSTQDHLSSLILAKVPVFVSTDSVMRVKYLFQEYPLGILIDGFDEWYFNTYKRPSIYFKTGDRVRIPPYGKDILTLDYWAALRVPENLVRGVE